MSPSPVLARPPETPTFAPPQPPVIADTDGDGLFEELEAEASALAADDLVSVLVHLEEPASDAAITAIQGSAALEVTRRFRLVDGLSADVPRAQLAALAAAPGVVHVELDRPIQAWNDTAQAGYGVTDAQADLPSLDGNLDGGPGYTAADVVVAVVDSGIDTGHLDLDDGKVLVSVDCVDGSCAIASAADGSGHGTHVAATIAGDGEARADRLYAGVAPGAALVNVRVLNNAGSGDTAGLLDGLDWIVDNRATYGIEIVNISLGAPGCSNGTDLASQAMAQLSAAGLLPVVAAGNGGPAPCTVGSPGAAAAALTVGAMADPGVAASQGGPGFYLAAFSSRGPTFDGRIKPDVVGPGVAITSADAGTSAGYLVFSGTSMATPFVAGVAALTLDVNPSLTPAQVKATVMHTAADFGRAGDGLTPGTLGIDAEYGAGRLDAYAAIRSAGAPINAPPPVPTHGMVSGTLSATGEPLEFEMLVTSTSAPIGVTMMMPAVQVGETFDPDFDIWLLDPQGDTVIQRLTIARQEEFGYQPTETGTYTLVVESFEGSGDFYADVSVPGLPPGGTFVDDDGSSHEGFIEAIASAGLTTGCDRLGPRYCPGREVTRGEMAAFLLRGIGHADHLPPFQGYFADVPAGQWFTGYVEHLKEHAITNGCSASPPNYCPNNSVTREQMAAFLVRTFNVPPATAPGDHFTDIAGSFARADINALFEAGITVGCGSGRYCPLRPVTRGEVATFIGRARGDTPAVVPPRSGSPG